MSQLLYHGVDLVDIERIAQAIARYQQRFLKRIYTSGELAYAAGRIESLAVRWAAKEATAKLLGVGLTGIGAGVGSGCITWHEVEVGNAPNGRPVLQLYGHAAAYAQELGLVSIALSLTHTRTTAMASIVAIGSGVKLASS